MNEILGGSQVLGLLSPELQQQAEQRARSAGLTNLGFALLQASQGQPGQRRPGLGQIIGQAGPVGMQAYQQSFDKTLQDMLRAQQIQDMQKQRAQQAQQQQQLETFVSGLPESEQARFRAFPTQAAEAMFREQKPAPGVVGEFQAAKAAGEIPIETTLSEFIAMKKPPAAVATAISGGRPDTFQEEVKKSLAKEFSEIRKSGIAAQRSAQDINRLETLLSKVDTGGAAAFKQAAGNFGIKTEGLEDIQAAQAIINKLVPAQRPAGSGPMSDADLELFKQSMPRIINQPNGNRLIIDGMKQINQYLIEEGKIAAEVTAGRITPEEGTARMFALGNPVQDFFEQSQPSTPQGVTVRRIR
jgi:flagellar protein FlgJ